MGKKITAALVGSAIALSASSPAMAATWDGNNFVFGLGSSWDLYSDFYLEDVDLGTSTLSFDQPSTDGVYTDIWDGGLKMTVASRNFGVDEVYNCTGNESDIDIVVDDDDLVITCMENWGELTTSDLEVNGEIRIYGLDGELVRYTLEIHNASSSDITDFVVSTNTNWGSNGNIGAYQNYDATVLTVPAAEDTDNAALLESLGSNWLVNWSDEDAPGSVAWGHDEGSVDVVLVETDGDDVDTQSDTFTVGAGETVYLVYFTGWDPAKLIELAYEGDGDGEYVTAGDEDLAAAAVAERAAEFDSFSGRLTRGLPSDANVLNWTPAPDPEGLAPTGADNLSIWAGLGLLVAGVAGRAIRRRVRA